MREVKRMIWKKKVILLGPSDFLGDEQNVNFIHLSQFFLPMCSQRTLLCQAFPGPTKRTFVSWGVRGSFRKNKYMQMEITLAVLCFVNIWSETSLLSRKKKLAILNIQND